MKRITKIAENKTNLLFKEKLKVAAYCRVSTDSSEQLLSLEVQKSHYEAYIKANPEWTFAGVYYDEGISGTKKEKRAGLLRLISDCENKKIDFIITKSISRFSRNTTDCLELVRKLIDLGIFIYFEKEKINTQSMESELMLSILSGLAESESVSIAENSKWSIQKRFRNGTYKISTPPYGYGNIDGEMVINKEQAEIVKWMFAEVLAGKGSQKIAEELNEKKVPTQKGGRWRATTVRGILFNEKYVGDVLMQKSYTDSQFNRHINRGEKDQYYIENHHEAIISREDFKGAAAITHQHGKEKSVEKGNGKYKNRYPFSGKIICSSCGSTFKRRTHGSGHSKYIAWCCSKHLSQVSECSKLFIREDKMERAFVTMMNKLIFGRKFILKPLLDELTAMSHAEGSGEIQEFEKQIRKISEQKEILIKLMAKKYLEPALFNMELRKLDTESETYRQQMETMTSDTEGQSSKIQAVKELLRFASKAEMLTDFNGELFERYVEKVIVLSREELEFELKCGITLRERM